MISIAAASVIAATMTGCGSSSSSSKSNNSADTVTSVEVVDGKVLNATAKATYFDDKNVSQTITLESVRSSKDLISGVATKGKYAYTVPESNMSIADKIRFITVSTKAMEIKDGKVYDGAYIDTDLSGDFNSTVDAAFSDTYVAVKGVAYVSPISTLVYGIVKDELEATGANFKDINTTKIDNAIAAIASKLNVSANDLRSTDPLAESAKEFGFINAMLGDMDQGELETLGKDLAAVESNATDFSGVIDMLADNVPSTQNNLFDGLKANIASGALTVDSLKILNFDDTRDADGSPVLATASATAIGNINSILIDNVVEGIATGDKLGAGVVNFVFDEGKATDANASGTVDLVFSATAPKDNMEDKAGSDVLTIKLSGIAIKRVNGITTFDTNATKLASMKTSYIWSNSEVVYDHNYVSQTDLNNSFVVSNTVVGATSINLATLTDAVEQNLTTETNSTTTADFVNDNLTNFKAAIVDNDGLLQLWDDSSDNARIWTTTTTAFGQGKTLINATLDGRGSSTAYNDAPTISSITAIDGNTSANPTNTVVLETAPTAPLSSATTVMNADMIVVNKDVNSTYITMPVVTANGTDTTEDNNTVTISSYPAWVVPAKTTLVAKASRVEFNLSINTSNITSEGNTTMNVCVKDEFGKKTDSNAEVLFFANMAPVITAITTVDDLNTTDRVYAGIVSGHNGTATCSADTNTTAVTCAVSTDGNLTLTSSTDIASTDINVTVTDKYGMSTITNLEVK